MRTKILFFLFWIFIPTLSIAQNNTLAFYYISQDFSTPIEKICEVLEDEYRTAISYDDYKVVFYLPNYDQPLIVKINTEDDNRSDFETLITEIRSKYTHDTSPYTDISNIVDIFDKNDFASDDLDMVRMNWYVNPTFWTMQYNESLIASLYFILELDKYEDKVSIDIWHSSDDGLKINRRNPFGSKNLPGNWQFELLEL